MSKVIKSDPNAKEDKELLHNFNTVVNLYWTLNLFTQIIECLDCIIHFCITADCIYNANYSLIFYSSLILNIISIIVKFKVFGSLNPFYGILMNNFPSKYSLISKYRLIQLWHRYNDIKDNIFNRVRRSTNSTKNFGYLNVRNLARSFIEDFGAPKLPFPPFCLHQIFGSFPQSLLLFAYIIYYDIYNSLYITSILISLISISCQIFNYFATTYNIHYSILGARFLSVVIDILGSFAMLSCLSSMVFITSNTSLLCYVFIIKFLFITIPLSLCMSWLFVIRSFGITYNPHQRPNIFIFSLHISSIIFLILMVTILSSMGLEIFCNFYWFGLMVQRLYNERFSTWDGNYNFWRMVIKWMLQSNNIQNIIKQKHKNDKDIQNQLLHRFNTDDAVLRLFSVNYNLSRDAKNFKDESMIEWMDDVYQSIYYASFTSDGQTKKINAMQFNKYSNSTVNSYNDIFEMIINEQIGSYFQGHNRSTVTDMVQYMADIMETFNFLTLNLMNRPQIDTICQSIFDFILDFTLRKSAPLYFISRLINILFPIIMIIFYIGINMESFTFIISICYYLSILLLITIWFVNINIFGYIQYQSGHSVGKLIFSLCPSLYRPNQLFVDLKHGYFTQHQLFEKIIWHYERNRYSEIEQQIVFAKFGKDIGKEIIDFVPKSYSEEEIACST